MKHEKDPSRVPRTANGYDLALAAFGPRMSESLSVADIGAGDSTVAEKLMSFGCDVVRYDAQYADNPPQGCAPYEAADVRDLRDLVADETFDTTISSCMMQHLQHGNGDASRAIQEMIRITKKQHADNTMTSGNIMIYPVWRPKKLELILERDFKEGFAQIGYIHPNMSERFKDPNGVPRMTLLIQNTSKLTEGKRRDLGDAIEASCALKKTPGPRDFGNMVRIAMTGNTKVDQR